jgi:hypothetical protein
MSVTEYDGVSLPAGDVETDNKYLLKQGENLKRGRLLKLDGDKLVGAKTGDAPHSILVEDTDATSGDTPCAYYIRGAFYEAKIDYGTGDADEFREALRDVGITLRR